MVPRVVFISIPRLSLGGGNLVALKLAQELCDLGVDCRVLSWWYGKDPYSVSLVAKRKGIANSLKNMLCFIILSLRCFLIGKSLYIATHHLTALFPFKLDKRISLVQDYEVDFYPAHLKKIADWLWKSYLLSGNIIVTNRYLAQKLETSSSILELPGFPVPGICLSGQSSETLSYEERSYDFLFLYRSGEYKNEKGTLKLAFALAERGFHVCVVNFFDGCLTEHDNITVFSLIERSKFLDLMESSRVFVCYSSWEGLGLPNLEALVRGCILCSTAIPSFRLAMDFSVVHFLTGKEIFSDAEACEAALAKKEECGNPSITKAIAFQLQKYSNIWYYYATQKIRDVSERH